MGNRSSKKFTINAPIDDKKSKESPVDNVESAVGTATKKVEDSVTSTLSTLDKKVEDTKGTVETAVKKEVEDTKESVESAVKKEVDDAEKSVRSTVKEEVQDAAESVELTERKVDESSKSEAEEIERENKELGKEIEDIAAEVKKINVEANLDISPVEYDGHEIILYFMFMSPPCRSVMITAKILGINLKLVECDVLKGDNKTPEFTKINPQQTIPTIDDQGFYLWESRPIMTYLVSKYAKDDSLYPKDEMEKAAVDQKLFFDIGTLYCRLSDYYYPALFHDKELDENQLKRLEEAVDFLNIALKDKTFSAGEQLTLADVALAVTVSNLQAVHFDFSKYPNIAPWMERTEKALQPYGYEEINIPGVDWFENIYKNKILSKEEIENQTVEYKIDNETHENIINRSENDDIVKSLKSNDEGDDFPKTIYQEIQETTEENSNTAEESSENN